MSKIPYTENISEMRKIILNAYPGLKWHERVMNMETNQVYAVYMSLREREKNKEKQRKLLAKQEAEKKKEEAVVVTKEEPETEYHQIDMFEYMADKRIKYN